MHKWVVHEKIRATNPCFLSSNVPPRLTTRERLWTGACHKPHQADQRLKSKCFIQRRAQLEILKQTLVE
jgi:hypothetical protein